jgi:hypothetical protein
MNKWKIPQWMEIQILNRDKCCVYCNVDFSESVTTRGNRASWEHIINDAKIVTLENIARCCVSCNASKGAKRLDEWLSSSYCLK